MCNFCRVVLGALFLCQFYSMSVDASSRADSAKKKWTILVFLNADNNLEDAGYDDVHEMEKVGSTDDVNVVVQFDYVSPEGTKRLYIEKNTSPASSNGGWGNSASHEIKSKLLDQMPEQDMGDPKVFTDFVAWGMKEFPAEHYMVVMWNHGSGWSKEQEQSDRGISYDDTSGNHISTNQLETSLDQIVSITGNHIDVLAFDACLMSMYEVADAMGGLVDYVVASEETIPWDGYPYDDFLKAFALGKDLSKENLVKVLVDTYGTSYSGGSQGNKNVTLAAVDMSKLEMVKRRLDTWVASLKGTGLTADQFKTAANATQSYTYSENKDLGDYVQNVLNMLTTTNALASLEVIARDGVTNPQVNGAIGASLALLKAIHETVVSEFNSSNFSRSTGLAIYLPSPYKSPYSSVEQESAWKFDIAKRELYKSLHWAKTTTWASYLDELFL